MYGVSGGVTGRNLSRFPGRRSYLAIVTRHGGEGTGTLATTVGISSAEVNGAKLRGIIKLQRRLPR